MEGGISFTVAFGTLTAEEAVVHVRRFAAGTSGANRDEEEEDFETEDEEVLPSDSGVTPPRNKRTHANRRDGVYECGTVSELVVAGVGFGENGRVMTGLEAVTVRLLQPGGTQEALPCVLSKDMTHYVAPIRWLHPGEHAVSVLIDGVRVGGTPIRVRAEGIEIGLSMSVLELEGVGKCVAGETAFIRLVARDHGGNPVLRGGAPLLLEARVPGEDPVAGTVTDHGDGTYEFSYLVEKAGPLEVALVLARKNNPTVRTLQVVCFAGPMEPSECRVDAGKLMLHWPAGDPAVVRVTRKDVFGNPTRNAGTRNRVSAEVVGPGVCDCEAVELGDGTCELRPASGRGGVVRRVNRRAGDAQPARRGTRGGWALHRGGRGRADVPERVRRANRAFSRGRRRRRGGGELGGTRRGRHAARHGHGGRPGVSVRPAKGRGGGTKRGGRGASASRSPRAAPRRRPSNP